MRRKICVVTLFLVFIGQIVMAGGNTADFKYGKWHLKYTLSTGSAEYIYQGKTVFDKVGTGVSGTYTEYEIGQEEITDGFGTGMCFTVTRSGENLPSVIQRFFLYEGKDYFLTDVALSDEKGVETNYLRPISTEPDTRCDILGKGDNRVLIVPFDNDKWVRYRSSDLRGGVNSFEVSAVYNADTRRGIVIGSVEHDTWKSGVRIESDEPGIISRLELYTGASGEGTRDVLPHGKVKGKTVRSSKTFFGYFEDWRDGMEEFGRACATIAPPLPWNLGTPFGWNSWAKMEFRLSYEKVLEVSDFFKENLQNNNFENNGIVYIGMDAGWAKMSDEQLADIARHCKANGQKAGIYFTPFSDWGKDPEAYINGNSGYKCKDAYLYANGKTQNMVAGGLAMDPTHPAIKERIRETAERFKRLGYEYIKIDFLTHGCAEADLEWILHRNCEGTEQLPVSNLFCLLKSKSYGCDITNFSRSVVLDCTGILEAGINRPLFTVSFEVLERCTVKFNKSFFDNRLVFAMSSLDVHHLGDRHTTGNPFTGRSRKIGNLG